jgi:hypothetical protein
MSQDFVVHPEIANLFRRWTPETKEANRKSFIVSGIKVPIVVWRDTRNEWWVIDGANRFELWRELKKKGYDIKLPADEFVGTEREALAHARGLNSGRRNLSASATAATAVFCYHLDRKMEMREQGLKIALPEGDQVGVAGRLAEEWSVSRTYIYDCLKLHEEARDILEGVRLEEININEAKIRAERKAVGMTPEPTPVATIQKKEPAKKATEPNQSANEKPTQEPSTEAAQTSKPQESTTEPIEAQISPEPILSVVDGIGELVPQMYEQAFNARADFKKQANALKKIGEELGRMAGDAGGDYLRASQLKADVRNLRKSILDSQPHALCPTCRGVKSVVTQCTVCKDVGFLDMLQWRLFAKENNRQPPIEEEVAA